MPKQSFCFLYSFIFLLGLITQGEANQSPEDFFSQSNIRKYLRLLNDKKQLEDKQIQAIRDYFNKRFGPQCSLFLKGHLNFIQHKRKNFSDAKTYQIGSLVRSLANVDQLLDQLKKKGLSIKDVDHDTVTKCITTVVAENFPDILSDLKKELNDPQTLY